MESIRSASAHNATATCFAIPELLELILRPLSMRTLLCCQLVNRTFYATIRDSPALQQRLFLAPAGPSDVLEADFSPGQGSFHQILVEDPIKGEALQDYEPGRFLYRSLESYTQRAVPNPFLFSIPRYQRSNPNPAHFRFTGRLADALSPKTGRLPHGHPIRRMFLCHPMPALVHFRFCQRLEKSKKFTHSFSPRYDFLPACRISPEKLVYTFSVRGREPGTNRPKRLGELMDEVEREGWRGCADGWRGVRVMLDGMAAEGVEYVDEVLVGKEWRIEERAKMATEEFWEAKGARRTERRAGREHMEGKVCRFVRTKDGSWIEVLTSRRGDGESGAT